MPAGKPLMGKGILFRQNDWLWEAKNLYQSSPKGDADVYLFNSYAPMRGELGSWIGATVGKSDALVGVDMPLNEHVTVFLVLQASAEVAPPDPDPEPDPVPDGEFQTLVLTHLEALNRRIDDIATHFGVPPA